MSCYLPVFFFLISVQKKEGISIVNTSSKFSHLLLVVNKSVGKNKWDLEGCKFLDLEEVRVFLKIKTT